jgi:hypothetical protein
MGCESKTSREKSLLAVVVASMLFQLATLTFHLWVSNHLLVSYGLLQKAVIQSVEVQCRLEEVRAEETRRTAAEDEASLAASR